MSRFLSRPSIIPFKAADTGRWAWTVDDPLLFEVGPSGSGLIIEVEQGFSSDLGSIPPLLRWVFNPADPQCAPAYLVHDKVNQLTGTVMPHRLNGYSSQFAAACLYEALALCDVPMWSRKLQYAGVTVGIANAEW